MVQREFFDNFVTNCQIEESNNAERLAWLDQWAHEKSIKRDCDILVDCDDEMNTLSRKVFGLDGIKIRKDKKIAERIVPMGITSADVALREELFCRMINLGKLVSPEQFERAMRLESPLDLVEE